MGVCTFLGYVVVSGSSLSLAAASIGMYVIVVSMEGSYEIISKMLCILFCSKQRKMGSSSSLSKSINNFFSVSLWVSLVCAIVVAIARRGECDVTISKSCGAYARFCFF